MSMISPEAFVENFKDMPYEELLPMRDELIDDIRDFEKNAEGQAEVCPSPSTMYQVRLEYLGKICGLIADRYRNVQWKQ